MVYIGELIGYIIYVAIIALGVFLGYQACVPNRIFVRALFAFASLCCLGLAGFVYMSDKNHKRQMELQHAGTYYLTHYPNCGGCKAILNNDNLYKVVNKDSVIEKGDWHFEIGPDYLIVYMNGKNDEMGSARFEYDSFMDKHGKVY